jgi:formylglycine-generating enzyme required for sulfatase activity
MPRLISITLLTLGLLTPFNGTTFTITQAQNRAVKAEIRQLTQQLRYVWPAENQPAVRDAFARQQAEAGIKLLRLGQGNQVWPLLRHSADPSLRTYLIRSLGPSGVDPALVAQRLATEKDVSARRALILSLAEFTDERLSGSLRLRLTSRLLRWYRDDPDSGIHGAIGWLLGNGKRGEKLHRLNWQQASALKRIDQELSGQPGGKRGWYVTRDGQTMTIVRGPVNFTMGSPQYEPGRSADETPHRVRIPRSFAIAAREVTVAQFQPFLEANPKLELRYPDPIKDPHRGSPVMKSHSPEDDCPQIAITWYEAAQYCNWLSQQEGIPQSQWVYPTNLDEIKSGMELPKDYLHRTGYRLLTEAEWEFAARAGANTSRFYGSSDDVLEEYAVYSKNPPKKKGDPNDPNDPQRTWLVGQLRPNDLGIFDIYGNVWEWGLDRRREYPSGPGVTDDVEDQTLIVNDQQWRLRRGGSFTYEASIQRSAHRGRPDGYFPMERRDSVGFRVGRTYRWS